ncbi:hypothetical protein D1007_60944 [Hordeum vulgare]|nr:hypothetical protein D1007_60944 [Hordeum vulgare]
MRRGGAAAAKVDLGEFFDQLDLNDEDFDDVVVDEDDPEINESVRWLTPARVHTRKTFSQSAFYKDMRAASNPTQSVRFIRYVKLIASRSKLLKDAREIMDMRLNGNTRGDYVRLRVKHDVDQPLTKFVSIVRGKRNAKFISSGMKS